MKRFGIWIVVVLGILLLWQEQSTAIDGVNNAPTADAGPDQTILEGTFVFLDGARSSDIDNDALSYNWDQIAGPGVVLYGADTAFPAFFAPAVDSGQEILTFRLTVTDIHGLSGTDEVNIIVRNVGAPITFEFIGEVRAVQDDGSLGGRFSIGDRVSGSYTFESTFPDRCPELTIGCYDPWRPGRSGSETSTSCS